MPIVGAGSGDPLDDGKTLVDEMSDVPVERDHEESTKLERGTAVDRYVVLYELGVGGMGVVYAAYDPELDRKVALKLLHAGVRSNRARNRLMREAKAIARLTHPNVVTVHDVGTYEGHIFVAMEYVDGVTLRQWVQQEKRSWKDIVSAVVAAGEGLAAAHAADLIHRDFKPDNVIVDRNGRVVVLDFGLARKANTTDDPPEDPRETPVSDAIDELSLELTRDGAKLGTPAYMAPEQHLGAATDRRTDQFSFCVVLWEAIYAQRPFKGDNHTTTALHVVRGDLLEPPRGVNVPTWLRTALLRGLSTDPDSRYPSIRALLDDLTRNPERRRRRRLAGGLSAGVLGLAGLALWGSGILARDEPCPGDAAERYAGVWDDARAVDVEIAFEATGMAYATSAFRSVRSTLDAYVGDWAAAWSDACEATHVHREQSPEALDLRMACLRTGRLALSELVDEFVDADAAVVEHAVEAAVSLPRIAECGDVEALAVRVRPPADDHEREDVEAARDELMDARAKESAGRYDQALAAAESVAERADELDYAPLRAEALLRRGSTLERKGVFEAAERSLLEAVRAAKVAGHDEVEAAAWTDLVWITGVERMNTEGGHLWAEFAAASLERLGRDDVLAATLTHNLGGLYYREGRYEEALEKYRAALSEQRRLLGADDPRVAMTLNHIGNVLMEQGQYAWAQEYCERSLEARRRTLGKGHPKVAASLNNLAEIARKLDDATSALQLAEESLEIVGGSSWPEEEVALKISGWANDRLTNTDAAIVAYRRLAAVLERGEAPTGPAMVLAWQRLAELHEIKGDLVEAANLLQRVSSIQRRTNPADAVRSLLQLSVVRAGLDDLAGARQACDEAAALMRTERLHDPDLEAMLERQRELLPERERGDR